MTLCPKCGTELEELPGTCQDDPSGETPCRCDDRFQCPKCKHIYYVGCATHHYGKDELDDPDEVWH